MYTEKSVNLEINNRVLKSFKLTDIQDLFVLVMTDISPSDVEEKMSEQLSYKMGRVLRDFHSKLKPFKDIRKSPNTFIDIKTNIDSLKSTEEKDILKSQFDIILKYKPIIQNDIAKHSNLVLHGDVGTRNYKFVDNKLMLIDYERARLGPAYQDFIKLFYEDFCLDKRLINSFINGYGFRKELNVGVLTQIYLIFDTSVGIFKYTDKIPSEQFKAIGKKMLSDVIDFLKDINHIESSCILM
ncbi:phosphotransferase [Lactobacillus sp. ESL0684]|uniref:phosphotransferase n=1 Tax=Lactobacillus sp. ESL0684 TaxID=2983213 RepID=UPI0023F80880|nr:phosphotransferase [Lactobacillus sp. ESL0684]WEV43895.1 phosphotransferase [Lactobacillus sp. ESL0684]